MCIYKITLHQKSSSKAVVPVPFCIVSFSGNPTFPNPVTCDMYFINSIVSVLKKLMLITTIIKVG